MQKNFYIKTFGCQMNKYASDSMAQILLNIGYRQTDDIEKSRIILVNTCTVREKAEKKALSFVGRLSRWKAGRYDAVIAVVGCVAQDKGKWLLDRFPHVDLVLGPRSIYDIGQSIDDITKHRQRVLNLDLGGTVRPFINYNGYLKGNITAFLKIMEGCDNFCTFCIVPYVRGRETSLPAKEIVKNATYLVEQGIREITLIGQNVNSYNMKNSSLPKFPGLLQELDKIMRLKRLRFTTSHPKDCSGQLINLFGDLKKLCPHIHLPVQSGSNKILGMMHRGYTREHYLSLIERLRKVRPDIAITSDVIVGFPGEKEEDFEDTMSLIENVEFDNIFSFKYSDRAGTRASGFSEKVPEEKKQERLSFLQSRQREITLQKNRAFENTVREVLVEGEGIRKSGQLTGRTTENKVVNFTSHENLKGELVSVRVIKGFQNSLLGEITGSQGDNIYLNSKC